MLVNVEVRDASAGLQFHAHAYCTAALLQCSEGEASVNDIDNDACLTKGPNQCAEFCTPFALALISDVEQGSCKTVPPRLLCE
jgi:hypothetical protein